MCSWIADSGCSQQSLENILNIRKQEIVLLFHKMKHKKPQIIVALQKPWSFYKKNGEKGRESSEKDLTLY